MINFVYIMINFELNFIYEMHTECALVAYKVLICCILSCHFVIIGYSVKSAFWGSLLWVRRCKTDRPVQQDYRLLR